jgi:hypothetical protein
MDPTSAVRMDAIPIIATVVAPGAFVSAPYLWLGLANADRVRGFLDKHEALTVAAAILLWIVVGFTVESLGSYIEVHWIDERRPDRADAADAWWRYLRIAWEKEPIGQRYLRRIVAAFKFELNMSVAAACTIPGVFLLGLEGHVGNGAAFTLIAVCVGAALGLFAMANTSSRVLAELRTQLLRGVGEPPFDDEKTATRV